jgi:hypothetical protein
MKKNPTTGHVVTVIYAAQRRSVARKRDDVSFLLKHQW